MHPPTDADTISRLDHSLIQVKENWMTFTKHWYHYTIQQESVINTSAHQEQNLVITDCSNKDVIYLLTVWEIAQAQKLNASLQKQKDVYSSQLV